MILNWHDRSTTVRACEITTSKNWESVYVNLPGSRQYCSWILQAWPPVSVVLRPAASVQYWDLLGEWEVVSDGTGLYYDTTRVENVGVFWFAVHPRQQANKGRSMSMKRQGNAVAEKESWKSIILAV